MAYCSAKKATPLLRQWLFGMMYMRDLYSNDCIYNIVEILVDEDIINII